MYQRKRDLDIFRLFLLIISFPCPQSMKGEVKMSGRKDFYERKERRIECYRRKAEKNKIEANQRTEQSTKILRAMNGQPLLIGHHSEHRHRADLKRIDNNFRKANELENKSNYYEDKADSAEKNNSISSDDPRAIEKLEQKLNVLNKQKTEVKSRKHEPYELPYISAEIKRIKMRIRELKELDELDFKEIVFSGGKVIRNKEVNRIQIIFEDKPDEKVRELLKCSGFKWARSQGAWQRLFNKSGICAAKCVLKQMQ